MPERPVILDPDNFDRETIASAFYRSLCLTVTEPEPWYLLSDQERDEYEHMAFDYLRRLADIQSFGSEQAADLWVYDIHLNDARLVHAVTDGEETRVWRCYTKGKNIHTYVLGESIFLRKDEALAYGVEALREYKDHQEKRLEQVMQRYAQSLAELEVQRGQAESRNE